MKTTHVSWIAFAVLTLASSAVNGAAQRTFVASTGVDTNPCSIVQPCRSFGAAIAKTLPAGEVIVLDSAGYGIVTIGQSISIIAPSGVYAGISVPSSQTGVIVNGGLIVVVLRGLSINGLGAGSQGVSFLQGQRLRIENCVIAGLDRPASRTAHLAVSWRSSTRSCATTAEPASRSVWTPPFCSTACASSTMPATASSFFPRDRRQRNHPQQCAVLQRSGRGRRVHAHRSATTRVVVENSLLSYNGGDGATVAATPMAK